MRREAQFLDVGTVRSARHLELTLGLVRDAFASDRKILDPLLLVFRVNQRASGELMIDEEASAGGYSRCIGYTQFQDRLADEGFSSRFAPLRDDISELVRTSRPARVLHIQHALIE
jgi:hypothetical protein